MIFELNFSKLSKEKHPDAKQVVASAFANTAKPINIMAGKKVAIIMKGETAFTLDFENEVKYIKVTKRGIINALEYHINNLCKKDLELAQQLNDFINIRPH